MTEHPHSARTRTITSREELVQALDRADLTHEEELVLRMRFGISEPGATKLQFLGTEEPEMAARLAMIESDALKNMGPRAMQADASDAQALKSSIIEELLEL